MVNASSNFSLRGGTRGLRTSLHKARHASGSGTSRAHATLRSTAIEALQAMARIDRLLHGRRLSFTSLPENTAPWSHSQMIYRLVTFRFTVLVNHALMAIRTDLTTMWVEDSVRCVLAFDRHL